MDAIPAAAIVAGVLALATAAGLLWRRAQGRARRDARPLAAVVAEAGAELGAEVTLLQFSTAFCAQCPGTSRALSGVASRESGVAHVDVDLTDRPALADRLNILQTPTVFVLDREGRSVARIGGAPRRPELAAAIDAARALPSEGDRRVRIA